VIRGTARGVLVQTLGPHDRPAADFSAPLDPVGKGTPLCTRAMAAAAEMVEKSRSVV